MDEGEHETGPSILEMGLKTRLDGGEWAVKTRCMPREWVINAIRDIYVCMHEIRGKELVHGECKRLPLYVEGSVGYSRCKMFQIIISCEPSLNA